MVVRLIRRTLPLNEVNSVFEASWLTWLSKPPYNISREDNAPVFLTATDLVSIFLYVFDIVRSHIGARRKAHPAHARLAGAGAEKSLGDSSLPLSW